ncbi:uncharacterized protein B0T23DRAFT_155598 [Neurospora hispaniola]|uniref:Uncharacterized protein n=1 Tax=Neurospora hispaniola TaxID=588809 RepID=A0AAJ0I4J2_9PEZI|nr:hypothetical protein B0T23DRAFT_155598 [Neurospora hispaniola]
MDRPEDIPGAVNGRGMQLLCCKMSLLQLMRKRGPPVEQRLMATKTRAFNSIETMSFCRYTRCYHDRQRGSLSKSTCIYPTPSLVDAALKSRVESDICIFFFFSATTGVEDRRITSKRSEDGPVLPSSRHANRSQPPGSSMFSTYSRSVECNPKNDFFNLQHCVFIPLYLAFSLLLHSSAHQEHRCSTMSLSSYIKCSPPFAQLNCIPLR